MVKRKPVSGRRYPLSENRRRGGRDPYFFTLTVQMLFCALLLGACWLAREHPVLAGAGAQYRRLLTSEKVELPARDALSEVAARYGALRERSRQAALEVLGRLFAPLEPEAERLTGAGGWFGTGDAQGKNAPSPCDLSPLVVSARVDAPVTGKVTDGYGWRVHPISGGDDFHNGVDIAAPEGSGIYASLPGRVSEAGFSAIYGNFVTLDHGNGFFTTYCHCERIVAPQNANLRRGELIARVGSTGISTGPHLHFEVNKSGTFYNPAWVLEGMNGYGI